MARRDSQSLISKNRRAQEGYAPRVASQSEISTAQAIKVMMGGVDILSRREARTFLEQLCTN